MKTMKFIFILLLYMLPAFAVAQTKKDLYTIKKTDGENFYNKACDLWEAGNKDAASKECDRAEKCFKAARHHAPNEKKQEIEGWINKCEQFPPKTSQVSPANKWTISWDEENQCIQLKNGNRIECYRMVPVEGGTSGKGETIMNFSIGETEVTELLWNVVMKGGASGNLKPKTNVSYAECYQFIDKLNEKTEVIFRLPEANEWEYAASGGNKTKGYKYAGSNELTQITFIDGELHPVKGKGENELGLYDMTGNASEWTSSLSQSGSRILKGGSYFGAKGGDDDRSLKITASQRFRDADKRDYFGFRIVKSYE